jgi:hypothetical protein
MSNMMEEMLTYIKTSSIGFEGKKNPNDVKLPSPTSSLRGVKQINCQNVIWFFETLCGIII